MGRSAQSRGRRDPQNGVFQRRAIPKKGWRVGDSERQRDGGGARVRREEKQG